MGRDTQLHPITMWNAYIEQVENSINEYEPEDEWSEAHLEDSVISDDYFAEQWAAAAVAYEQLDKDVQPALAKTYERTEECAQELVDELPSQYRDITVKIWCRKVQKKYF